MMELYNKLALLNKMDVACNLKLGSYQERVDLLDQLERHYQPHVYENDNLLRKLLVPVIIAEHTRPKLDPWTETQELKKNCKILGYTSATLFVIVAAGVFWRIRTA
ncbi:unnamed protein product [Auanema sp. JU1783]|nr:unnamed protein product [Auanema sp. JU1783]